MYLRKLHYNVMLRTLEKEAAEVLAVRANTVSPRAGHYPMVEVDRLTGQVADTWSKFGVNIDTLIGGILQYSEFQKRQKGGK